MQILNDAVHFNYLCNFCIYYYEYEILPVNFFDDMDEAVAEMVLVEVVVKVELVEMVVVEEVDVFIIE